MTAPSIATLRRALTKYDLPGTEAQYRMAHRVRRSYGGPPPDARAASVLALLYPVQDRLHLLFIQRTSPPGDHHAGQISFPGGSAEASDRDARHTALREAEEEVGIDPDSVEVLGKLSPLYIPISNFLVRPFVAYRAGGRPEFRLQESEVARTLELPLDAFFREDARVLLDKELANGLKLTRVPHWRIAGEEVWGATAMITAELIELIRLATDD